MLYETRKLGGSIDSQKKNIDALTTFSSKMAIDSANLEEPLNTIAKFIAEKEKYEFERTAHIKLFEMQSNALRQLQEVNGRCSILLDHARIHWPGRDTTKSELNKCKMTINELEETINYAKYALTRITEPIELAQKLIDLEAQIIKFGSDRLLMVIENILKRATIQRSDVFEAVKAIRN